MAASKFSVTASKVVSRPEEFCRKGVLKNLAKFIGKHLCLSLVFDNVTGMKPATLFKKRLFYCQFLLKF